MQNFDFFAIWEQLKGLLGKDFLSPSEKKAGDPVKTAASDPSKTETRGREEKGGGSALSGNERSVSAQSEAFFLRHERLSRAIDRAAEVRSEKTPEPASLGDETKRTKGYSNGAPSGEDRHGSPQGKSPILPQKKSEAGSSPQKEKLSALAALPLFPEDPAEEEIFPAETGAE